MATRKVTARTAFLAIVDALAGSDAARESVAAADAALTSAWNDNGDAASSYVFGHFGDGLPVAGRPAADSPEIAAWSAILSDLGITGPEDDRYSAARKRVQRVRWACLLHAATGAPWAECGKAARDMAHARTLVARGADAVVVTEDGARLAPKSRATGGTTNVVDSTPVTPGATAPTATDVAVQAVAASTMRNVADTLHGIADKVRRADVIDPAVRAAMLADARAIVAALEPVAVDA